MVVREEEGEEEEESEWESSAIERNLDGFLHWDPRATTAVQDRKHLAQYVWSIVRCWNEALDVDHADFSWRVRETLPGRPFGFRRCWRALCGRGPTSWECTGVLYSAQRPTIIPATARGSSRWVSRIELLPREGEGGEEEEGEEELGHTRLGYPPHTQHKYNRYTLDPFHR